MQKQRFNALNQWLDNTLAKQPYTITPLVGDASFRHYYRIQAAGRSFVAMDAPPEQENSKPFIAIAQAFAKLGVHVPQVFAFNLTNGFLLLSDLGDRLYLNELRADNAAFLYKQALNVLAHIQSCREVEDWTLPSFDRDFILKECHLFQHWFLEKHLGLTLSAQDQHLLANAFELLSQAALEQPQVCVHRDYHSRNLLVLDNAQVGVLDFQDAVWGPITYDAVSLLRDCYITWPREQVARWINDFYQQLHAQGQVNKISSEQFIRWFDLLGIQRNLKAIGIFARLQHLYGKNGYLKDIPIGLNYVLQVTADYPELKPFHNFLQTRVMSVMIEIVSQ